MKKTLLLFLFFMLLTPVCSAQNVVNQVQNSLAIDKWAHIGLGYIINDQLKRETELTPFERFLAVSAVAYAKEKWADPKFDRGDMVATMIGGLLYEKNF